MAEILPKFRSRPVDCTIWGTFAAFLSSHPLLTVSVPFASNLLWVLEETPEKPDPGPQWNSYYIFKSRRRRSVAAEITITLAHSVVRIWNISLTSTWRPSGALEFISNTDKYVLNHGRERFNLQLECRALDNPLAALCCCYGTHSLIYSAAKQILPSLHMMCVNTEGPPRDKEALWQSVWVWMLGSLLHRTCTATVKS